MSNTPEYAKTFNSITEILELISECGTIEDLKEYKAELLSLSEDLNKFYTETTAEIAALKEKNKTLEDENEKLKEENRKLKAYIKSMSAGDYKISTAVCKKDYDKYWELLEEESQRFLVTSYFVLRRIKGTNVDFSAVVLCLCKPYETEIKRKIFLPFIIEQSKLPILEIDRSKIRETIENYKLYENSYIHFKIMLANLEKAKFSISYQARLHDGLSKNHWNLKLLLSVGFHKSSLDYVDNYRNLAAHDNILEEKIAIDCKIKTKEMLTIFLSASPKSK